ncbi:MAG: tRNA epoxyqueuosine(34) reductase QueG [Bacteroidetes bacterium]|nr:tRNA epoxyqueuosine(34) reductase QueG [Bacteroidota bacterium]
MNTDLSSEIRKICREEGFFKTGFSKIEELKKESDYLNQWICEGRNADMNWISNTAGKRGNPRLIMDDAVSMISLAYLYDTPCEHKDDKPKISRYAWGKDYHKILKKKLKSACAKIEALEPGIKTRAYVDDGPVLEKSWAVKSGIGWQGKHTNIIEPEYGSFFFICEILVNKELDYDRPADDLCGSCSICASACPTGAIYEPYKLDANLCISYQTIENRNEIPSHINTDGWIFGCDICQDVCPYNKKKFFTEDNLFLPNPLHFNKSKEELSSFTEEQFNNIFSGTPVKRTKFTGWKRNLSKTINN